MYGRHQRPKSAYGQRSTNTGDSAPPQEGPCSPTSNANDHSNGKVPSMRDDRGISFLQDMAGPSKTGHPVVTMPNCTVVESAPLPVVNKLHSRKRSRREGNVEPLQQARSQQQATGSRRLVSNFPQPGMVAVGNSRDGIEWADRQSGLVSEEKVRRTAQSNQPIPRKKKTHSDYTKNSIQEQHRPHRGSRLDVRFIVPKLKPRHNCPKARVESICDGDSDNTADEGISAVQTCETLPKSIDVHTSAKRQPSRTKTQLTSSCPSADSVTSSGLEANAEELPLLSCKGTPVPGKRSSSKLWTSLERPSQSSKTDDAGTKESPVDLATAAIKQQHSEAEKNENEHKPSKKLLWREMSDDDDDYTTSRNRQARHSLAVVNTILQSGLESAVVSTKPTNHSAVNFDAGSDQDQPSSSFLSRIVDRGRKGIARTKLGFLNTLQSQKKEKKLSLSKQLNPDAQSKTLQHRGVSSDCKRKPIKGKKITIGNSFSHKGQESSLLDQTPERDRKDPFFECKGVGLTSFSEHTTPFKTKLNFCKSQPRSSERLLLKKKTKEPEVVEILDDSESEMTKSPPMATRSVKRTLNCAVIRIAIGTKVFCSGCQIRLRATCKLMLEFEPHKKTTRKGTESLNKATLELDLQHDLTECKYYLNEEFSAETNEGEDDAVGSFLAIKVVPNNQNGLKIYSNSYQPDKENTKRMFILIEFRENKDLRDLVETIQTSRPPAMDLFFNDHSKLDSASAEIYCQPLIDDCKREARHRQKSMHSLSVHRKNSFLAGRKEDDLLLIYPFDADEKIFDQAAVHLTEAKYDSRCDSNLQVCALSESSIPSPEQKSADCDGGNADMNNMNNRSHLAIIRVTDYERLVIEDEYLNDTLIDFWMLWISRFDDLSKFHVFSSHFYTSLFEDGSIAVTKWTERKGIDVFDKKFIFVPINKSLHWSLCVVVNPGQILQHPDLRGKDEHLDESSPMPCILFLDSLKAHQKTQVAHRIRQWLNSEWQRLHKSSSIPNPFQSKTMPVIDPKIPYQNNSWDCGVFVCRYAFALYKLRNISFSFQEYRQDCFRSLITNSEPFQFDMKDITRLRQEMKALVENLCTAYVPWKSEQDRKAKEDRRKAKAVAEETVQVDNNVPEDPDSSEGNEVVVNNEDKVDTANARWSAVVKGIEANENNIIQDSLLIVDDLNDDDNSRMHETSQSGSKEMVFGPDWTETYDPMEVDEDEAHSYATQEGLTVERVSPAEGSIVKDVEMKDDLHTYKAQDLVDPLDTEAVDDDVDIDFV